MNKADNKPILSFDSDKEWERWLKKNYDKSDGIWMCIHKKGSGKDSVYYAGALDIALCYGWIDGQKKSLDEHSWLQKFTPRRARSGWSKVNTKHAERLISEGRMQAAGMKQIKEAKKDGRWGKAYDSQKNMVIPDDFLKRLAKDKNAEEFFKTLNKSNLYSIAYLLQTAKREETREKRIEKILGMMKKKEVFHFFGKKPKS